MLIPTNNHNHPHTLSNNSSRARFTTYPAAHHSASFSESRPSRQWRDTTRENTADPSFQQTKTRLPYTKHIATNASPSHPQCLLYVSPHPTASSKTFATRVTIAVEHVLTSLSGKSRCPPGCHRRERRERPCRYHASDACQSRRTGDQHCWKPTPKGCRHQAHNYRARQRRAWHPQACCPGRCQQRREERAGRDRRREEGRLDQGDTGIKDGKAYWRAEACRAYHHY
jgi:hypothetical protein